MSDLFSTHEKLCNNCKLTKPVSEFYWQKNRGYYSYCKECTREKARDNYKKNPDKYKERIREYTRVNRDAALFRNEKFYYSKRGRALNLFKSAQGRAAKKGWEFTLTREDFLELINDDFCSVTGLPFSHEKPIGTVKNPFAASIDRIDSSKPYERGNIRLVIWQYNLMKGEISDRELYEICKKVIEHHEKSLPD